jgi:hypothetical protein
MKPPTGNRFAVSLITIHPQDLNKQTLQYTCLDKTSRLYNKNNNAVFTLILP